MPSRDNTGTLPPGHVGPSKFIRQWVGLSAVGETVDIEPYHPGNGEWASTAEVEVNCKRLGCFIWKADLYTGWIQAEKEGNSGSFRQRGDGCCLHQCMSCIRYPLFSTDVK